MARCRAAYGVVRQVAAFGIGAAKKSAGRAQQVRSTHIRNERVPARSRHISTHIDRLRTYTLRLAVNHDVVARLNQNIVERVSGQSISHRDIENLPRTIRHRTEDWRSIRPRFRCETASLVNSVAKILLATGPVVPWRIYLPSDQYFRHRFKVIAAEDPNRVEGLEFRRIFWMCQRRGQIES